MELNIDDSQADLQRLGWSVGDALVCSETGPLWMVYAHRNEERVVVKATSQTEAWRETRRMADSV